MCLFLNSYYIWSNKSKITNEKQHSLHTLIFLSSECVSKTALSLASLNIEEDVIAIHTSRFNKTLCSTTH